MKVKSKVGNAKILESFHDRFIDICDVTEISRAIYMLIAAQMSVTF